jgi:hypothetical protein
MVFHMFLCYKSEEEWFFNLDEPPSLRAYIRQILNSYVTAEGLCIQIYAYENPTCVLISSVLAHLQKYFKLSSCGLWRQVALW